MTNAVYPKYNQRAQDTGGNLLAASVKALLVDTAAYTYNSAHQFLSDVAAGARVGSAVQLASKGVTQGQFTAAGISFAGLVSAPSIEAIVLYVDTGNEATSYLVAYIDTATGLPVSAGATQVDVTWASYIFAL